MTDSGDLGTAGPLGGETLPVSQKEFGQLQYFLTNPDLPTITICIFLACSIAHLAVSLITKKYYMLPLVFGCILEITGQFVKIFCLTSTSASQGLNFYVIYSLMMDLVPCFFLTSIGAMLVRIIKTCPRRNLPSTTRRAFYWIIFLESTAFSLQSYGLLVRANPILTNYRAGRLSTVVGCGIESLNLILVWTSLWIILRKRRKTTHLQTKHSPKLLGFVMIVAISVLLVSIRSILRLVFYLSTTQVEPFGNDLQIFLFESLPLAAAAVFLIIFHPCRFDHGLPDSASSFCSPCSPTLGMKSVSPSNSQKPNHVPGSPINRSTSNDDSRTFCTIHLTPRPRNSEIPDPHIEALPCEGIQSDSREKHGRLSYHRSFSSAYLQNTITLRQDRGRFAGQTSERGGQRLWLENDQAVPSECDPHETYDSGIRRRPSAIFPSAWSSTQDTSSIMTRDKDNEEILCGPDGFRMYSVYQGNTNILGLASSEVLSRTEEIIVPTWDNHDDQDSVYSVEEDLTSK